jgi:LacI family transcriptional regulator
MKGKRRKTGVRGEARRARAIVTLEDVARAAGVHYSTVSRALDPNKVWRVNAATQKRVQSLARRMGYQRDMVASALKRGRTHTVAVVVGDLGNPTIARVLRGIANRLEPAGLMSLVGETQDDSERLERILNHLLSRRVDAIIVAAARLADAATLRRISRQGIPVVLVVQGIPGIRLPACTNDDLLGGTLAAQHLLSLGHRRVAQLRGPVDMDSCFQRAKGFSVAIAAAGATEVKVRATAPTGSLDEGRRLMSQLLDSGRELPTGIFTHNDLMAFGALTLAEERGLKAPRDLSIIGFHDLPLLERTSPPLTSIRVQHEEMGRIAAEMTVQMLTSPGRVPPSRRLVPTLVVRESTAPLVRPQAMPGGRLEA